MQPHNLRFFGGRLLRFLVQGVFAAETAILVELKSVGVVLFVLFGIVVSLLAFGARQSDSGSTSFCHIFRLPKKLTPPRSAKLFYTTFEHLSIIFYYIL
jgi:hypothetical protein